MIEQLVSLAASQSLSGTELANSKSLSANTDDVMKFNGAMMDKKVENNTLLDVSRTKENDSFLQIKKPQETNPIVKMDQSYKSLLLQMKEVSHFDKHWDVKKADKAPVFRSNITTVAESPSAKKSVTSLLDETKAFYKTAMETAKNMSDWSIKVKIWFSNIKLVSAVVQRAGSSFKTLFHSAG